MYAQALRSGLLPNQFWDMTFFEYREYSRSIEQKEELEWNRQSVMMSLHANMNAPKGKRYEAADFNPFAKASSKQEQLNSGEDVKKLAEKLRKRGKRL